VASAADGAKAATAPFPYVPGKAYYVLPETHNNQSGYFSLCEGLDGKVYVGTARYGENAFLVEFDPASERQRIVIDTNALCGLSGKGYAAQAKIHTRNFVGPVTGRVYVGSKQGYRQDGDTQQYAGGYVMAYDPRVGRGYNLGMPFKGEGIIDVTVDERRNVVYVVTCEQQHWVRGDLREDGPGGKGDGAPRVEKYREIGPPVARYATTLLGADGCAYAITADLKLARYDPAADKVTIRPIDIAGRGRFARTEGEVVPTWVLAPDAKLAYLILMDDPTLLEIPLGAGANGEPVKAVSHGKMLEGKGPDSRGALTLHPDGRVYALVRVNNETGFGGPDNLYLHHLVRFDPAAHKMQDLGVLKVQNPDYFDFSPRGPDHQPPPYCNGFHRLPDGALTPLHHHMALAAAHDGTLYATVLGPFTLLRIDGYKLPPAPPRRSAAADFVDEALAVCDRAERNLDPIASAAEVVADRYAAGGNFGFPFGISQPMAVEMWGRSGGIMDLEFKPAGAGAKDSALVAFQAVPGAAELEEIRRLRSKGCYVVGFGPREATGLSDAAVACDALIDSSAGDDAPARGRCLANVVHGWCFTGELVAALTRRGRMPVMWKGFTWPDGKAWAERYAGKRFHDDLKVPPVARGELARRYLSSVRHAILRLKCHDEGRIVEAARLIREESAAGRKTVVAWTGHVGYGVPRPFEAPWASVTELAAGHAPMLEQYRQGSPDGALVLRLGQNGQDLKEASVMRAKRQRVIHAAGDHPDPAWRDGARDSLVRIDLGTTFGDACVTAPGYPMRILPPSAVMQLVTFGAIDAQVRADP
jgi:hypothetical protein